MKCETCDYYVSVGDAGGNCRRFPPVQDGTGQADEFPTVKNDYWCGEHKEKGIQK